MKTPGLAYRPGERLTVHGISPSLQHYAIEIADPVRAAHWVRYLSRTKYVRRCFDYRSSVLETNTKLS